MSTATKIVFTVTTDLTYDQRMQRICHSLSQAGFDILLVGRRKKQSIPLIATSYQQKRLHCFFEKGKLFYIEYNIRLFFFLLSCPTQIISSIDLDTLLPCLLISKLRHKKCVYDAHEYFSEVPEVVNRPLTKKIWEGIAAFCIPRVDAAYTVSASLKKVFSKRYDTSFELVRNITVGNAIIPLRKKQHPPILFYQGALNEGRGLEILLQIMTKLENVELWIAGEGDLSDSLKDQSNKLGVNHKVKFLGYVLPSQLKAITLKATIGLNLLANKGLSYYYSLANKTFDYIHAGLPAIHPNFPEYQQLNTQYSIGLLVDDLKEETLLKVISTLINDKELYIQLQQNCLKAARELTWQVEEKRLIDLYQNLLE